MGMGTPAAALSASERARARGLLDLLNESRVDVREGVDASLLDDERKLQAALNAKGAERMWMLLAKHTTGQAAEAKKEISDLSAEYDQVQARIRAKIGRASCRERV